MEVEATINRATFYHYDMERDNFDSLPMVFPFGKYSAKVENGIVTAWFSFFANQVELVFFLRHEDCEQYGKDKCLI